MMRRPARLEGVGGLVMGGLEGAFWGYGVDRAVCVVLYLADRRKGATLFD